MSSVTAVVNRRRPQTPSEPEAKAGASWQRSDRYPGSSNARRRSTVTARDAMSLDERETSAVALRTGHRSRTAKRMDGRAIAIVTAHRLQDRDRMRLTRACSAAAPSRLRGRTVTDQARATLPSTQQPRGPITQHRGFPLSIAARRRSAPCTAPIAEWLKPLPRGRDACGFITVGSITNRRAKHAGLSFAPTEDRSRRRCARCRRDWTGRASRSRCSILGKIQELVAVGGGLWLSPWPRRSSA